MPSEEENIQYLYLVLTHGGNPTIDWDPICAALQLERGAVTKRWSRLKQSMAKGEKPTKGNYEFLWLMVKHSARDKPFDWDAIARGCNSTKGACSKRYSRLKKAFDDKADASPTTTITPRRKRAPPTKKATDEDGEKFNPGAEDDEDEEHPKPKRVKSTPKPKPKPKPKNGFRASDQVKEAKEATVVIKGEVVDDDGNVFLDTYEQTVTAGTASEDEDQILPVSVFSKTFTHAREMANVLLSRKSSLTDAYRAELEGIKDVFDEAH